MLETLLPDHVANADELGVVGGDPHRQVALSDLEHEVEPLLALDGAGLDRLDECSPVVGVDDGLADLERHVHRPFDDLKGNTVRGPLSDAFVQVRGPAAHLSRA